MAGDIQEPFRLSFQVDSIHSGSISFGRFELESLSWERRSSFSHNRYLEEVEKYARPGSVTEKKAYFEAHFRRKALLRQASSESQIEKEGSLCENGSYETASYEENNYQDWYRAEEPQHIHQSSDACHFDQSSEGSYCDGNFNGVVEREVGLTGYQDSETEANVFDVNITSHFDESPDDSSSSGAHQGEEFVEEAHSDPELELAQNGVDLLEKVVRCYDSAEKFKSNLECNNILMDNAEYDVKVEIITDGQATDVPREEDISHFEEAIESGLEILHIHAPQSRAEDKIMKLEPAPNSTDLEDAIRCCDNEEKFKTESECNDAVMDNVYHDIEVETIPNGQAPEVQKEECISHCTETRGSASEILQTHASKSRAEEKTRASAVRSRAQSSESLTRSPQVKNGTTAQSYGWRERQTPLRTRNQKPMSQLKGSSSQSSVRISKTENPHSSKAKTAQENRSEKDLKPKRGVALQPSTPERTEPRRHPSTKGIKQIASTNNQIKRCVLNTSFRSEQGKKMKEIRRSVMNSSLRSERGGKIREQKKAGDEASQSAKKPTFKAKPLPSFYHRTVPQGSSINKPQMVSNSSISSKAPSESLCVGSQMGQGSVPCSKTVNVQPISPSKCEGSHASLGRRNCNAHSNSAGHLSSNTRNHTSKVTQPKVVVKRK